LRFAGKVGPQTAYYFIIDRSKIPLPDDFEEVVPREIPPDQQEKAANSKEKLTPGRYLKKVSILEGK
jgi:hypothetical protein